VLYKSDVFSHYLNSETSFLQPLGSFSDDSDVANKRDVKLTDGGLFYHDGPYVSHSQVHRKAQRFDSFVTPLPEPQPIPTLMQLMQSLSPLLLTMGHLLLCHIMLHSLPSQLLLHIMVHQVHLMY
jgi:hypothetical protein